MFLLVLLGTLMIVRTIRRWHRLDVPEQIGNIAIIIIAYGVGIGVSIGTYVNSVDRIEQTNVFYPSECEMMHDKSEVVVKYGDKRFSTTDHLEYIRIIDSNFYLTETRFYNHYGKEIEYERLIELVTFDSLDVKESPIKIKL